MNTITKNFVGLTLVSGMLTLSSCGGGGGSSGGGGTSGLAFDSSSTITLLTNSSPESSTVDLTLTNGGGATVDATITSSNTGVATVNPDSCALSGSSNVCPITITAISSGTATITATAAGYESQTINVNVNDSYQPYVATSQFAVFNNCPYPLWIQSAHTPNGDNQVQKVVTGGYYNYHINGQESVNSFKAWPKTGCDKNGENCVTGQQVPPCPAGGCPPPVDSTFEGTFNINGTHYDGSLVNGYTLPFEITVKSGADETSQVCESADASQISLDSCPTDDNLSTPAGSMAFLDSYTFGPFNSYPNGSTGVPENLTSVNERVRYLVGESSILGGCMAPETVLTYSANYGGLNIGANAESYAVDYYDPVIMYACPFNNSNLASGVESGLPPQNDGFTNLSNYCNNILGDCTATPTRPNASNICNDGPINGTKYVSYIHQTTSIGIYAQTYDDARGSLVCNSESSHITFTLCPGT